MEIYAGVPEQIPFRVYAGGQRINSFEPVYATLYRDNEIVLQEYAEIETEIVGEVEVEWYHITIDPALVEEGDSLLLTWEYAPAIGLPVTVTDRLTVVRPYVSLDQVRQEFPLLANRTYEELRHIERVVRYTINNFCGQDFGKERDKTYVVQGTGQRSLWLPKRLLSLTTVTSGYQVMGPMSFITEGRSLAFPGYAGARDIKADIGLVPGQPAYFAPGYSYTIRGDWGWDYVPEEIQQAARILMGRFNEPEQTWRRYNVDNIRANDWRMEFTRTSLETTGDVDVDMMLSKYKVPAYGVI